MNSLFGFFQQRGKKLLLLLLLVFLLFLPYWRGGQIYWGRLFPPNKGFELPKGIPQAPLDKNKEEIHQTLPIYQEEILNPNKDYYISHVATLTQLPNGRLAAAWYGGSEESMPDVKIYFSRQEPPQTSLHHSTNQSTPAEISLRWSSPKAIMTRTKALHYLDRFVRVVGNPLLFCDRQGVLHLLYITVGIGKWSGSQLNIMSSQDEGISWKLEDHFQLAPFFNFAEVIKNPPIALLPATSSQSVSEQSWVIPIHQEFLGKFAELLWLSKKGSSWRAIKSRVVGGCSFLQPTIAPIDSQKAVMLFRDYRKNREITEAFTYDGGKSWSHPRGIGLPNHDTGICALTLSNGWLLLAFDDTPKTRNHLRLALSTDQGKSWHRIATIAEEKGCDFSYPYFYQASDGVTHLLYTYKRTYIHHVFFNLPWIEAQEKAYQAQVLTS